MAAAGEPIAALFWVRARGDLRARRRCSLCGVRADALVTMERDSPHSGRCGRPGGGKKEIRLCVRCFEAASVVYDSRNSAGACTELGGYGC